MVIYSYSICDCDFESTIPIGAFSGAFTSIHPFNLSGLPLPFQEKRLLLSIISWFLNQTSLSLSYLLPDSWRRPPFSLLFRTAGIIAGTLDNRKAIAVIRGILSQHGNSCRQWESAESLRFVILIIWDIGFSFMHYVWTMILLFLFEPWYLIIFVISLSTVIMP